MVPFLTEADWRAAVAGVARHLEKDGLLGYPTETIYGLGGLPNDGALDRLYRAKGRAFDKPVLLVIAGRAMASAVGLTFSGAAEALAARFWPGPVTLVVSGGDARLPERIRGPRGGVAVRDTPHPGLRLVVSALGQPLTSTSANREGEPPATDPRTIERIFADEVAMGWLRVLDGGPVSAAAVPSTVVDCTTDPPTVLREGAVRAARVWNVIGGGHDEGLDGL